MGRYLLALLLVSLAGCQKTGIAGVETIIAIQSGVASVGLDVPVSSACAWIIGRTGTGVGLSLVIGHGGISAQECMALGPP